MTQHYDVAVVGMQPSGIIAAALLAKRGRRVLLADHGEDPSTYRKGGLRLPLSPQLIPALDGAPHVDRVHNELGVGPELRMHSQLMQPGFQAVTPTHRMDVWPERKALLAEVAAEFPDLAPAVERFFERLFAIDAEIDAVLAAAPPLPPATWRERLQARGRVGAALLAPFEDHALLAEIPPDHPLRDILLSPLAFFGHLPSDHPSTFHAVRLIARYFRGAVRFGAGLDGWMAWLLATAEKAGVEVKRGAVVREIAVEHRRLVQMELEGDRQSRTADFFVDNSLGSFETLLPPKALSPHYAAEQKAVRPTGTLLMLNLVVKRQVIPCGLAEVAFLLNGRRQSRDGDPADAPLLLQRHHAERGALSGGRKREVIGAGDLEILSVACPARTDAIAQFPDRFAALKDQMLQRVRRVVPFLDDNLLDVSLPVETSTWDHDGGSVRRVDPWRLHPIFETTEPPLWGVAARPTRTFYKNLVHCGRDVVPGLGIEGDYVTATAAASALQKLAGKRWRV